MQHFAIAERVRKLEDEGIIEGYSIKLNREKIGLPVMAFFKLRVNVESCKQMRELAIALPEVIEAHRVVGNEHYILQVALLSMQHLESLVRKPQHLCYTYRNPAAVAGSPPSPNKCWHRAPAWHSGCR